MFIIPSDEQIEIKKQEAKQAISDAEERLEFVKALTTRLLNGVDVSVFFPEIEGKGERAIADFFMQENYRTDYTITEKNLDMTSQLKLREALAANTYISICKDMKNNPSYMLREYSLPMQNEAYEYFEVKKETSLKAFSHLSKNLQRTAAITTIQQKANLERLVKEFNSRNKIYDTMALQHLSVEETEKIELMSELETCKDAVEANTARLDKIVMIIKISCMGKDDYREIIPENELEMAVKEAEEGINISKRHYSILTTTNGRDNIVPIIFGF